MGHSLLSLWGFEAQVYFYWLVRIIYSFRNDNSDTHIFGFTFESGISILTFICGLDLSTFLLYIIDITHLHKLLFTKFVQSSFIIIISIGLSSGHWRYSYRVKPKSIFLFIK